MPLPILLRVLLPLVLFIAVFAGAPSPARSEVEPDFLPDLFFRPQQPARYTLLDSRIRFPGPSGNAVEISKAETVAAGGIRAVRVSVNEDPEGNRQTQGRGIWSGKSYLIPALEIPAFNIALNAVARVIYPDETQNGKKVYDVSLSSFWHNLAHGAWEIDSDKFTTNQIQHSYQGSIYQGLARSAGLNFWESAAYTFAGSLLWETGSETTPPSFNDMVTSGIAGNFLGEALFRMAGRILESGERNFWREFAAGIISPPTAFNRHFFGDRFKGVFPSYGPATFSRGSVGGNWIYHTSGGNSSDFERDGVVADFVLMYGLPGKPGYSYNRPFDYFEFQMTAVSNNVNPFNPVENLTTRGLLVGTDYEAGPSYRGIWGLYGSYDYIARDSFRVSTTALSLGTTGQWWLSRAVALQGTLLAGLGYGAGGRAPAVGNRDYHYGLTGQGLLSLRLLVGDKFMLEATRREYFVTDAASSSPTGRETIGHLDTGITFRVKGRHAVGLLYRLSNRDGEYAGLPTQHMKMETISLVYTILSDTRFGAVEWRGIEK